MDPRMLQLLIQIMQAQGAGGVFGNQGAFGNQSGFGGNIFGNQSFTPQQIIDAGYGRGTAQNPTGDAAFGSYNGAIAPIPQQNPTGDAAALDRLRREQEQAAAAPWNGIQGGNPGGPAFEPIGAPGYGNDLRTLPGTLPRPYSSLIPGGTNPGEVAAPKVIPWNPDVIPWSGIQGGKPSTEAQTPIGAPGYTSRGQMLPTDMGSIAPPAKPSGGAGTGTTGWGAPGIDFPKPSSTGIMSKLPQLYSKVATAGWGAQGFDF